MEEIKIMKKTLQECKEIVAKESNLSFPTRKDREDLIDLANKMYYEQSEWVLCDDDMPEPNKWVLILINDKHPDIDCLRNEDEYIHWEIYEDANVTHWAELPSPPKQ